MGSSIRYGYNQPQTRIHMITGFAIELLTKGKNATWIASAFRSIHRVHLMRYASPSFARYGQPWKSSAAGFSVITCTKTKKTPSNRPNIC